MRALRVCVGLWLTALAGYGQTAPTRQVSYFNQFQRAVQAKNLDSALYNAQQLAFQRIDGLNTLLHDSFAQSFRTNVSAETDTAFANQLLRKMYVNPDNRLLQQAAYPLYGWQEVKRSLNDTTQVRRLVDGFLVALERSPEEQGNRIDRYALLLYDVLKGRPAYTALADTLFAHTRQRLEHAVNGIYYVGSAERRIRDPRAYFRFLTAYSYYQKARDWQQAGRLDSAETYYKQAAQFSPDELDRQARSAYFYEAVMLLNDESVEGFIRPYADFLLAKGYTASAVRELTELTLADPSNIEVLKTYYAKAPVSGQAFGVYWNETLNAKLKPADPFQLVNLDGKTFDYAQHKGKWVLIDFWGTWCKPCVAEMPELQKLYTELRAAKRDDIVMMTVACHDTQPRVREFMQKNGYTFAVGMGNEELIKQFRVGEYPTKVLITPQGNRLRIPFGTNWVERVTIYTKN